MVGMQVCCYNNLSLRFATLLILLLVTIAIALHGHLTRVRSLDESSSIRRDSEYEEYVTDPRVGISDMEVEEESAVEFINDLTINLLEEANALREEAQTDQFLEQLENFRWFECPPILYKIYVVTSINSMKWRGAVSPARRITWKSTYFYATIIVSKANICNSSFREAALASIKLLRGGGKRRSLHS